MFFKLEGTQIGIAQREITPFFAFNWLDFDVNKKDMKPFHIDRELECPILFKNVLSCLRTSYPILEHPNTVLEHPILF